jgi:ABC-type multidrug transport system fused ATPase/permease subunit
MLNLEIYRKTLRRPDVSILSGKTQENGGIGSNMGRVVNLMSTDANRISAFLSWWFSILTAPTQIIIGIYFLYSLLGWACLLGLLVMVVFIPCHHVNVKMLTKAEEKMMGARDQRVSLMNEALQGIRQIKFFAWEKRWEKRILETRTEELKHLKTIRISEAIFNIFWNG